MAQINSMHSAMWSTQSFQDIAAQNTQTEHDPPAVGDTLAGAQTKQLRWCSIAGSLLVHASVLLILAAWLIPRPPAGGSTLIHTTMAEDSGIIEPMVMSVVDELAAASTDEPAERLFTVSPANAAATNSNDDLLTEATIGSANGLPGGAGGSSKNGKNTVGFFGLEAEGTSFVFIVDYSGSMEGSRFSRARTELVRTIGDLTSEQQFFVIFYNHNAMPMYRPGQRKRLIPATDSARRRAIGWINKQRPHGGTYPDAALQMALRMKPDVIFFLSDGAFQRTARTVAKEANSHGTIIHTIAFEFDGGKLLLKGIAEDNQGRYRFVE